MPRPKNTTEQKHIKQLMNLTYQTFGKPLTHSFESEHLSNEIKRQTGIYLSPQTLRRLFGFLKTEFSPSVKTLNGLAVYNGFPNWHAFTQQPSSDYQPLTLDQEANLYLDFYKIEMKEEADMNYHNASRNIALRILFNSTLLAKLSPALARNPVSQVYFFEHFPFIDGLAGDYKRSIRLYLQNHDHRGQVFGNSLLFLSAFLTNKHKELKPLVDSLNSLGLNKSMHPFIVARVLGSNIMYQQVVGGDISPWLEKASEWNRHFLQKNVGFWRYPYFQHMICDYLNIVGLFEESYRLKRTIHFIDKNYEIEKGYPEALEVIKMIAGHSSSNEEYINWFESTKAFESIHPLFKKYYRLQALSAYSRVVTNKRKKLKATLEMKDLFADTGFTFFEESGKPEV